MELQRLGSATSVHLQGHFTATNAAKQNTGQYEDRPSMISPEMDGKSASEWVTMRQIYQTPTRLDFSDGNVAESIMAASDDASFRNSVEAQAVFARGREEDNRRLRLTIGQLERRIWELEKSLTKTSSDLQKTSTDLQVAERTIAQLLGAEDGDESDGEAAVQLGDDRAVVAASDIGGDAVDFAAHGADAADDVTEPTSKRARCEENNSSDTDVPGGSGDDRAAEDHESRSRGRIRKAEEVERARALVESGAELSRAMIGTLSKATAAAYLSSMRNAPVRGNQGELRTQLQQIFDFNGIDTFRMGDAPVAIPQPSSARVKFSDYEHIY